MPGRITERFVHFRAARRALAATLLGLVICTAPWPARAITIQFDYSYDAAQFFGTAASPSPARKALEFAGRTFTPFFDSLAAIQPTDVNTWSATLNNPASGVATSISNLAIPQNAVIVFAGAYDLPSSTLGLGGQGGYSLPPSGPTAPFRDAVRNRGQGIEQVDTAPWGGFISFDTTSPGLTPRQWSYDVNVQPTLGTYDFFTVAVHEMVHLLGFGLSTSFVADVNPGAPEFLGPTAVGLYGGAVPLDAARQHFALGVTSPPFVPATQPKPSLGPSIAQAERKSFTPLDYAVMADIGWQVPPELLRLPGDADGDNDVDGADFILWQRNLGGFGGSLGDVNGDLIVDDFDGWIVRRYLGAVGVGSGGAAAIPEPGSFALLAVGGMLLVAGRRVGRAK